MSEGSHLNKLPEGEVVTEGVKNPELWALATYGSLFAIYYGFKFLFRVDDDGRG